jgi:hypothetical protein
MRNVIIVIAFLAVFFASCKPSICDCKSIGYDYALRDLTRYKYVDKWRNCKDSYSDEISNWQKTYSGPCYSLDPALCFFDKNCN